MNPNLLKITSIPISIEVNVTNGSLKAPENKEPLKIDINRTPGGYKMESRPAKINIDTYAARSSMGYGEYNASDFNQREADRGFKIAYQGVARIVNEGDQLARGVSPSEIAAQQMRAGATIETAIDFLPKGGADVSFDKGTLSINYTPTDINIDWENIKFLRCRVCSRQYRIYSKRTSQSGNRICGRAYIRSAECKSGLRCAQKAQHQGLINQKSERKR